MTVAAGNCSAGEMFDGTSCKTCPVGSYQNEKYQNECKSCDTKMTTASTGARSKKQCMCKYILFHHGRMYGNGLLCKCCRDNN